jgi:hypothetical protein
MWIHADRYESRSRFRSQSLMCKNVGSYSVMSKKYLMCLSKGSCGKGNRLDSGLDQESEEV